MKRNMLLFAFFLIGLNAISQNTLGVKAGINLAYQTTISNSTFFAHRTLRTKPLFGYQFGMFYKTEISKKLAFSTEANFSVVGSRDLYMFLYTTSNSAIGYKYVNDKIGYIEVPLLMQYNLNPFYVSAGPSLSFRLFSKSAISGSTLYYKPFDFAGNLLAGFHVSKKWDVNLCYSYGLLNINEETKGDTKRKNRNLNLSLLYALK